MTKNATFTTGDAAKLMEDLKINEGALKALIAVVKKEKSSTVTVTKTISKKIPIGLVKKKTLKKTKLLRMARRFLEPTAPIPKMPSFNDSDDDMN